jgi:hypothetical protein
MLASYTTNTSGEEVEELVELAEATKLGCDERNALLETMELGRKKDHVTHKKVSKR